MYQKSENNELQCAAVGIVAFADSDKTMCLSPLSQQPREK